MAIDENIIVESKKEATRIVELARLGLGGLKSHDLVVHCLNKLKSYLGDVGEYNYIHSNPRIGEMDITYNGKYEELKKDYYRVKDWNKNLPQSDLELI